MKTEAIQKIKTEFSAYEPDRYGKVMKKRMEIMLTCLCENSEAFARAVVLGGSIEECMKETIKKVQKSGDSDFEALQYAADFYAPGGKVECSYNIRMPGEIPSEQAVPMVAVRLEDFFK